METHSQYRPVDQSQIGSFVLTFVGGLAVGYALAALFVPRSGREVRSALTEYAKSTSGSLSDAMQGAVDAARRATRTVARRVTDVVEQGKDNARSTADTVSRAADEVVREAGNAGYQ
ncbi:MAG: YtxH domain-containing protein [Acidiferrobacter sp.]